MHVLFKNYLGHSIIDSITLSTVCNVCTPAVYGSIMQIVAHLIN